MKINLTELNKRKEGIQGDHAASSAFRLSNWVEIVSITEMDRFAEKCQEWGMQIGQ